MVVFVEVPASRRIGAPMWRVFLARRRPRIVWLGISLIVGFVMGVII